MKSKETAQPENGFPAGLSQPAHRALANAGIERLDQLTKFSEADLKKLHGLGPKGIDLLSNALAAKGLSFAEDKPKKN